MSFIETPVAFAIPSVAGEFSKLPAAFHERYIATRPIPYGFIQTPQQPSSSGGVLARGQAVWLEQPIQRPRLSAFVRAFVENVGFISLDPRLIKRGEGSLQCS